MLAAMELRHLRYFVAVAEMENVSRAALRLRVSQPALSRQIRDLEGELGFLLLERSAKSVRLTEAGRVFLNEARAVLQRAEAAVLNARAVARDGGSEIHVGYAPSVTAQILPQALRAFQARFPGVRVILHDLSTEEMITQLCAGRLHLALVVRPTRAMLRGLKFQELARYSMRLAVLPGHALAGARTVTRAQAAREPLIAYSRKDYPEYHETLAAVFAGGPAPHLIEEHDSVTSLVAAIEAGRGIALMPECIACMVGSRLKLVPLKPVSDPVIVGAAWRKESETEPVKNFIAAAAEKRGL